MLNRFRYGSYFTYCKLFVGHEVLLDDGSHQFRIIVVTDLDKSSKHPTDENRWQSFMEFGILTLNKDYTEAFLKWNSDEQVDFVNSLVNAFLWLVLVLSVLSSNIITNYVDSNVFATFFNSRKSFALNRVRQLR